MAESKLKFRKFRSAKALEKALKRAKRRAKITSDVAEKSQHIPPEVLDMRFY